jgi:sentrin-specific protease 8
VILLRPSMVHLLKSHKNPRELLPVLPDLRKASHVFMPINDCRDLEVAEGGSHWSLLVVGITDRIAFHYDSLSPSNNIEAQIVHAKLEKLLGFNLHLVHLNDTPQQENGSDCGVHVCWAMKHLLVRRLLVAEREQEVDMSLGGKRLDASRMRREMYRICESLRKKASRSSVSPMSRIRGDKESPPRIGTASSTRAQ